MAPIKLCIVTHTFLPHVGGIERVVFEQSKRLMKKDYAPTVLTHRNYTPRRYTYDGVKVQCYDALNIGFRLGIPYPIPNVTSFKQFLEAAKTSDLIHAHGHPYLSSLASAKLAKRYKKPFVLTQHNTFIDYNGFWDTVEKANDLAVGTQSLQTADRIVVISQATRNYVLRLGADPQKVQVIYNGVDLDRFKPMTAAGAAVRKKLGISPDATVAATVRRLVYKNGIDTLLETAAITAKQEPELVYLVIGNGPDFADIRARAQQLGIERKFVLAGYVSDEDLASYYNAADFFVLPSKSGEGLPLVALEGMACGLPVVATAVGGIAEILVDGYGLIVPPNNPELLARASLNYAQINFANMKANLRQIMTERYSWDVNVAKLLRIYEEII